MTNISLLQHNTVRTLIFILATSLAGFASAIGSFDRSFQVNGNVDLEVLTRSGDITVRNGAAGTVSIHATIHSGGSWLGGDHKAEVQELQNNPPIRQNGNSIHIDYVNINNISIDYEITAPENSAVHSHTGSGNQNVEGLKGNVDLESGSGAVSYTHLDVYKRQPITEVEVKSKASGIVKKLYVDYGDQVKKGQLLAELDRDEIQARVDQARAQLEASSASLNGTRADLVRAKVDAEGPDVPLLKRAYERCLLYTSRCV